MPAFTGNYKFPTLASAPTGPVAGQMYFDTTTNTFMGYNGSAWVNLAMDPTSDYKNSVRAASTANVNTASPGTTLDGVTLAAGDRILLKDQTAAAQNGIYTWSASGSALVRATDGDTSAKMSSQQEIGVAEGTVNASTDWQLTTADPITLATTGLAYTRIAPPYGVGNPKYPWAPTSNAIMETLPRAAATNPFTMATAATHLLAGGIIIPAGRPVTNANFVYTTAAATITIYYVSLIRQSDLLVLATSANSTAAWAAAPAVKTTAFSSAYTPPVDTAVYVGIALASTTAAIIQTAAASTTGITGRAPILCGTTTAPTTTPVSGTAGAVTATTTLPYMWLT